MKYIFSLYFFIGLILNINAQVGSLEEHKSIMGEAITPPKIKLLTPKKGEGDRPSRCFYPKNDKGQIEYQKVIDCNLSQKELYSNFQRWIIKTFNDYKRVVQLEDVANGKIILKGTSKVRKESSIESIFGSLSNTEMVAYTIILEAKDGRYRYTISDITVVIYSNNQALSPIDLDNRCISLKKADASVVKDIEEWIDSEKEQISILEKSLNNNICISSSSDF